MDYSFKVESKGANEYQTGDPNAQSLDYSDLGWKREDGPIIEVKNITSLVTHHTQLVRRSPDLALYQEHSANLEQLSWISSDYRAAGR